MTRLQLVVAGSNGKVAGPGGTPIDDGVVAPIDSPAFTGTPTAPTPSGGDSSTRLATTSFVAAALSAAIQGLSPKQSVQWATQMALAANTYSAGVLTATGNGALAVDGNAPAVNDRVLVKNEATAAHNGIYAVTATGDASHPYVLTRTSDFNAPADIPGAFVYVEGGSANAGHGFFIASEGPFVIGTTAINFSSLGVTSLVPLDQIAASYPTSGNVDINSHKLINVSTGTASTDAANVGQLPSSLPPNGSAGGDLAGSYPNPSIGANKVTIAKLAAAVTLDAIATANATAADISMSSHKITNLLDPTSAQDAATKAYADSLAGGGGPPTGSAGGDLAGTYPNPTIGANKVTVAKLAAAVTLDAIATANATAADVAMAGFKITGLGTPTASTDAATKGYADGLGGGGEAALTVTAVKTANYTAAVAELVACDASGGSFTTTLPTAPADKTRIGAKLVTDPSGHSVTVAAGGSDVFNVAGGVTSLSLTAKLQSVILEYRSASAIWYVLSTDNTLGVALGAQQIGPALVTSAPLAADSSGRTIATARGSSNFSTASIAANASENDNVTLYKVSKALKVTTNRPARVRAYATSAYRTADASRAIGTDPTGDHGLLLEVVTTATVLGLTLAPAVTLQNEDGSPAATIYFATQNLDTSTGAVTVTFTLIQEE